LENLAPISNGGGVAPIPDSILGKAFDRTFGSFDAFVKKFPINLQNPGYLTLAFNTQTCHLEIITMHKFGKADQICFLVPLLVIDNFMLDLYDQTKSESCFQDDLFKVINWEKVNERLLACKSELYFDF